jgi:hypothetical protein
VINLIILFEYAPHQKRLVLRLGNWSVHTSRASTDWLEEHGMFRMLYPPCLPDLARATSTRVLQ